MRVTFCGGKIFHEEKFPSDKFFFARNGITGGGNFFILFNANFSGGESVRVKFSDNNARMGTSHP